MNTFVGVVAGIIGLGFLILVHELGHFIVAKALKMRVEEFSIGFGRYLVKRRWRGTIYGISVVPLGGYVRVTGMHEEEFEQRIADLKEREAEEAALRLVKDRADSAAGVDDLTTDRLARKKRRPRDPEDVLAGKRALSAEEIASTPLEQRYYSHPLYHKLMFIVAGVFMNMLVAFIILYGVGVTQGEYIQDTVVSDVSEGSAADEAGIMVGDRVLSIDGQRTESFNDLRLAIVPRGGKTVTVVVLRDGAEVTIDGVEIEKDELGVGRLGVWSSTGEYTEIGVAGGFAYAGRQMGDMSVLLFRGIGWMFSGDVPVTGPAGPAGPVGIVQISGEYLEAGFAPYMFFLALISINLGVLNMLPLLPLDGGHVVLSIVEKIRGRRVSMRVFERVSMVGLGLFALLFILAMYNDVSRLFSGL